MYSSEKIKHLEFIERVINRLANNSFLIRGWVLTFSLAGLGFFIGQKEEVLLLLIFSATTIFWFLDAYYLRQERLFRKLYTDCLDDDAVKLFKMDVSEYKKDVPSVIRTMFSYPITLFYIFIFVVVFILYCFYV